MFTLGDVADILDNALDMGINIVEALHKLAEAGDKGQVSKDECISQLELSGGGREGSRDSSSRRERAAGSLYLHGDGVDPSSSLFPEECQTLNYEEYLPAKKMESIVKDDKSYDWEEITSYVTVQDLDRESWSKRLHGWNEHEISPLRISSSNVRLEESKKECIRNEICDTDVDYYDAPLKKFKSKRWSNTFALNMEDDSLRPQATRKVSNSASRHSSVDNDNDSDDIEENMDNEENYISEDEFPKVKRQRRNTYSIETTPVSEAEGRGLPIIDALDDLCAMADQFMDVEWVKVEGSSDSHVYGENNYEFYGSEDEVPSVASKLTDEKILALDEETVKAYRSFTDAVQTDNMVCSAHKFDGKTIGMVENGSSLDQIVDQKIADIGSQAEIVLESFRSLRQLRQYGRQQSESEFEGVQDIISKDIDETDDVKDSHYDLQNGSYIIKKQSNDHKVDTNALSTASRTNDTKKVNHVNGVEKVETEAFGENNGFSVVYSTVEEVLPYEFQTIADVTYDYTQAETTSNNIAQISSSKSKSDDLTERKRPGTYLIENPEDEVINFVYEEPVFIKSKESSSELSHSVDASQNISSDESTDLSIENREKVLNSNELGTMSIDNGVLKNSHTCNDRPVVSTSSVKAIRPGTYVLSNTNQNVNTHFDADSGCMKDEYKDNGGKEVLSSHSQLQNSNGSKRRPGTFILQSFDSKKDVLECNSDTGINADKAVLDKQFEPSAVVSHDNKGKDEIPSHSQLQYSNGSKRRPGTFILQSFDSKKDVLECNSDTGFKADTTVVDKKYEPSAVLSHDNRRKDEIPSHSQLQYSNGSKRRPGTFILQSFDSKKDVLECNSDTGFNADTTVVDKKYEPSEEFFHDTVPVKKRPCTYVLENNSMSFGTEICHVSSNGHSENLSADISSSNVNSDIHTEVFPKENYFEDEGQTIEDGESENFESVSKEKRDIRIDKTLTDKNIPSRQGATMEASSNSQFTSTDNAILNENEFRNRFEHENENKDTIESETVDDRNLWSNDSKRNSGSSRLGRPGTYVLSRLSLSHDSSCVTKNGSFGKKSEIEYAHKPALDVTPKDEETRPKKPRPSTYKLDTAMRNELIVINGTESKTNTARNEPINDCINTGDTVNENHDQVISKQSESGEPQGIKRDVKVRRPRPSTYKVNRALSRVLRASDGLSTEGDTYSSADKQAGANTPQDTVAHNGEFSEDAHTVVEYHAPKFKRVSNDMPECDSNADGENYDREIITSKEDHEIKKIENRSTEAGGSADIAVDSGKVFEVRSTSLSYAWEVSERTVITDLQCSENMVKDLAKDELSNNDIQEELEGNFKNEFPLSLKEELIAERSEKATESFREPATEESVRNCRESTAMGNSSELRRELKEENELQAIIVDERLVNTSSLDYNNTQSTSTEFVNVKEDCIVEGGYLVDFASNREFLNRTELCNETSIKAGQFCSGILQSRNEKQTKEAIKRVVGTNTNEDLATENEGLIGSPEKRSELTMNNSEMNNNDLGTVEKDFSYKSDYGEMADECTVLSTLVQNDCCPNERFDNEAAGFDLSKEPVITRVNDPVKSQGYASAKAEKDNPTEEYLLKQDVCENTRAIANASSTSAEYGVEVITSLDSDNRYHPTADEDCNKPTVNQSILNTGDININAANLKTNIDQAFFQELSNVKSNERDDMKGGRIAVKLEINFADSYENRGTSSHKRGAFAREPEGRDANAGQGKSEDTKGEDVDFVDSRNEEDDVRIKLQIDDPESPDCTLSRRSSQGIRFDIGLDDHDKKIARPPVGSKQRLSMKNPPRRKTTERPGTYVLNSPVFSRDQYENVGELQEQFGRRSLGSSDGGDLHYEIKKAVEQGRLELNYDSPEDVGILGMRDADVHSTRNLHTTSNGNGNFKQSVEQLNEKTVNDEAKISKASLRRDFNTGMKEDCMSFHGLKVENLSDSHSVEVNDDSAGDDKKSEEVVLRSSERLQRTGTYVLRVLADEKNDVKGDNTKTYHPGTEDNENCDNAEEKVVIARFLKPAPGRGLETRIEVERSGESDAQAYPVSSSLSPRKYDTGRKSRGNTNTESIKDRFEKFRRSFDKQRIGFFVDLNSEDINQEMTRIKQSHSQQESRKDGFQANIIESLAEDVDAEDNKSMDLAFLKPENGARGLSSEINTMPNVCVYDQKIDSMPMFNYSEAQLKDCKISSQDHKEDYNLIKNSKKVIKEVFDYRNGSTVKSDSELDAGDSLSGLNSSFSPMSGDALNMSSEHHENIIHRRSSSSPVENERKLRYSSWDITPDTEKEVLGKITSLKDCPSSHSTGDDTVEGIDVNDVTEVQTNCYMFEWELEEDKGYSSELHINSAEKFDGNCDAKMSDTWEECGVRKEKKSSEKSECCVVEDFNEEDVQNRRSDEKDARREMLKPGTTRDGAMIRRKNTFKIESVDSSKKNLTEGNKEVQDIEANKTPISLFSRNLQKNEELRRTADSCSTADFLKDTINMRPAHIKQNEVCRASEILPVDVSPKSNKITGLYDAEDKKEDLAITPSNISNDIDTGIASLDSITGRSCNDEAVVEDYDLYVSNGSRPASGTSEIQPVNERRHSGEIASLASSVISSNEDLELEDVRNPKDTVFSPRLYPLIQEPSEVNVKVFNRQLSDTIVALSHRSTLTNDENDISRSYDEAGKGAVQYMERQLSENIMETKANAQGVEKHLTNRQAFASVSSPDNDLRLSPFKILRSDRRQNFGHRPMSYDVARKPLLERLERLCTFMSKSLTKLNNMSEGESEIVSKLDKIHGREDLFLRKKGSNVGGAGSNAVPLISGNGEKEIVHSGTVLPPFQENIENDSEDLLKSDATSEVKLREPKIRTKRGQTYVIQKNENMDAERTENEPNVSVTNGSSSKRDEARDDYDLNSPTGTDSSQCVQWKAPRRRDDANTPRGSLAPRLAILKMQLEEKRRHIEEEKRRMREQWTEERAKLGQQAFWLAVGKDTKEDIERMEREKEAAMAAERKKKPGLTFIPFSDENDPGKVLKRPPKKRNMNELSPNERSMPTSSVPTTQHDPRILSTEAEYTIHHNRIGSKTIMEVDRIDKETFVIDRTGPSSDVSNADISNLGQASDNVFINDPEIGGDSAVSRRNKTRTVSKPYNGHSEFLEEKNGCEETDRQYAMGRDPSVRNTGDNVTVDKRHRTAWAEPHMICPTDFPIIEGSQASAVIENDSTEPYVEPHSYRQLVKTQAISSGFTRENGTTESSNEIMNSPRHQRGLTQPGLNESESGVSESPRHIHVNRDSPREKDVAPVDHAFPPQGESLLNVGEELEIGQTTLTPEQQKKKEKFIQNRIKRQQEEKAKRGAELEKKRKKEEKLKERKAALEKKERDEQERIRRQRHEDEYARRREEEELERRIPPRFAKREEQSAATSSKKHGSSPGSLQVGSDDVSPSSLQSAFSEYKGPPVYVKPTGKSNRQIMVNAISYCCLSGEVNREAKEKSLQVLGQSNATHFFVLFRDGLKFRGLFTYSQENDEAHKIYGLGPKTIVNKMVERLFKYSSGAKSFSQIPAKSLSIQVDGIQIKKEFWQSAKAQPPSKTDSNLRKGSGGSTSRVDNLKKGSPRLNRR